MLDESTLLPELQDIIINTVAHLEISDNFRTLAIAFQNYDNAITACNNFMMKDRHVSLMEYLALEEVKIDARVAYHDILAETPEWIVKNLSDNYFEDRDALYSHNIVYC